MIGLSLYLAIACRIAGVKAPAAAEAPVTKLFQLCMYHKHLMIFNIEIFSVFLQPNLQIVASMSETVAKNCRNNITHRILHTLLLI